MKRKKYVEDIVWQAEKHCPYDVILEDLLSQAEFEHAYGDLANIEREFRQCTTLDGVDLSVVITAAALQTLRWVLMPTIGNTIDKAARITSDEGEALVKKAKKEFVDKHEKWSAKKEHKGRHLREQEGKTWKEIVFSPVPYDAISGSKKVLKVGLSGRTHRYRTLGHDPILGWIFGTANILTDTLTLNNLVSYRVKKGSLTDHTLLIPQLLMETSNQVQNDKHKLPAAIFRQALHYKSDIYTKDGLPVPLLGAFSETLAGNLYTSQYDFLCFLKDSKIEGASTGNVAAAFITKNAKMLDVGGLLITISRLYTDTRFIARAKEEFIQGRLDSNLEQLIKNADEMRYVF